MTLRDGPFLDLVVRAPAPTLCLAFANTLLWRGSPEPSESLPDVSALLAWCEHQAFSAGPLSEIRTWSSSHPEQAAAWFADAISLRETIYRVFESLAADKPVADEDFTTLSEAIAAAPARAQLERQGNSYGWRIAAATRAAVLAPVLWSAADLLLDSGRRRIRQCANEKCLWLFVDESKSGTRRWCDMTACGNRAKAQRHYARTKRA